MLGLLPPSLSVALPPPLPTHLGFTESSSVGLKPVSGSQNRCRSPGSYRSGVGLEIMCMPNRLPGTDPAATLGEPTTPRAPPPPPPGSNRGRVFAQRKHMQLRECSVAQAQCLSLLGLWQDAR